MHLVVPQRNNLRSALATFLVSLSISSFSSSSFTYIECNVLSNDSLRFLATFELQITSNFETDSLILLLMSGIENEFNFLQIHWYLLSDFMALLGKQSLKSGRLLGI